MKKSFLVLLLVTMLTVVGCADNKEANNTKGDTNNNNQVDENDGENEDVSQSNVNQGVMELGETGFVDDELGEYEITPTSFEIFTERDGETPMNDGDVFVLIDYTVKFLSDEEFEEEDLLGIRLLLENSQGNRASEISYYDYEFVDNITGMIEPGKSYDSQLLFEIEPSEESEYTLQFGSYAADVEDAEWSFTESEAK